MGQIFQGLCFFRFFCSSNAHGLLQVSGHFSSFTSPLVPGCVQGAIISLSACPSVCVCVTFAVFTDCESRTTQISTNPGSMEASKDGLTHGTCFVARGLEVVAFAGLLRISWCVLGAARFFRVYFGFFFFFKHRRPAASMGVPLPLN